MEYKFKPPPKFHIIIKYTKIIHIDAYNGF